MLFVFQRRHLAGQGFQFVLEHLKFALFLEGQLARADLGRRGQRLGFRLVGVGSHGLGALAQPVRIPAHVLAHLPVAFERQCGGDEVVEELAVVADHEHRP